MRAFTVSPEQTRSAGDPRRIAIILPGGGYTPAGPLLHFARAVLVRPGWTVSPRPRVRSRTPGRWNRGPALGH